MTQKLPPACRRRKGQPCKIVNVCNKKMTIKKFLCSPKKIVGCQRIQIRVKEKGSAPAPGAVNRALAVHSCARNFQRFPPFQEPPFPNGFGSPWPLYPTNAKPFRNSPFPHSLFFGFRTSDFGS